MHYLDNTKLQQILSEALYIILVPSASIQCQNTKFMTYNGVILIKINGVDSEFDSFKSLAFKSLEGIKINPLVAIAALIFLKLIEVVQWLKMSATEIYKKYPIDQID